MKRYLPFPPAALLQHMIALGKTRSGKSSKVRVAVEYILDEAKHPITIVDKKGDWYGLKSSADGKQAGYPLVIFGGKHADVPLNPRAGKQVAELLSGGNRSAILDIKGWSGSEQTQFYIDFVSRTFQLQDGGLRYLCIPEVHNFAPKGRVMSPKVGEMLHWTSMLAAEGQGLGLVLLLDSQRPQKVHNDVLSACETLIACRVTHTADRGAVKEWIDGNGDPKIGQEMLAQLAGMPRTDAYVWSPEEEFGPTRITWEMFKTFDSFKPQERNPKKLKGWADVDLDEVTQKLAAVIEEHKANDPDALKARIRELERVKPAAATVVDKDAIDQARAEGFQSGYTMAKREGFGAMRTELADRLHHVRADVDEYLKTVQEELRHERDSGKGFVAPKLRAIAPTVVRAPTASQERLSDSRMRVTQANPGNGSLPVGETAVLGACIQFPDGLKREQLTVLTGYKRSTRDAYIQRLREKGYVDGGDRIVATESGIAALPNFEPLPTGEALQEYWLHKLPDGESKILRILIDRNGQSVPRDELTELTGYKRSTRDAYLQRMTAKQLVNDSGRGQVAASETLFS